jgi:hypothetical protein
MPTCRMCRETFPNRTFVNGKFRNLQHRRFCLTCSPFGLHNTRDLTRLETVPAPKPLPLTRWCPKCQQTLAIEDFYRSRKSGQPTTYCRVCANRQTVERQQRLKQQVVEYLGGCCMQCGYDRYIGCLELHHLDPSVKEFDFAYCRTTTFEKIKPELDKCILLCANCHREEHARLKGLL